jgi:hypothetical protein
VQMSKQKRRVVQVRNVSDELWARVKQHAETTGTDIWKILEAAMNQYLNTHQERDEELWRQDIKKQLNRIEAALTEGGTLA